MFITWGAFHSAEILEISGGNSMEQDHFPEKIFDNLGQPFQSAQKVKILVFSKSLCYIHDHKQTGKNSVRNLQYGPRTQ